MESIEYWFQTWPLGELCVATSPLGLRRILWSSSADREATRSRLGRELGQAELHERKGDKEIQGQLEEFFAGQRKKFDLPIDPRPRSSFQERVLRRLMHSRAGELFSYGELATAAGHPGAARAVGRVMATNPLPIVIPCHRVVPADRTLGNYTGGIRIKKFLLGLEGLALPTKRGSR